MTTPVYGANLLMCKGHAALISDTLFDHGWNVTVALAQSPHRGVSSMATPETMTLCETSAMPRRRSPSLLLPEEPSREELAQFWTLSDRDRAEVLRCQGEANQRRFAV